jgi:CRISPR-associated protein Csx17
MGIFRIVAEQADPLAQGFWRNGVFVLSSKLAQDEIAEFFLNHYRPTPVIVPWSGGDFFNVSVRAKTVSYSKTPSSSKIIEAFLATSNDRLADYRTALHCALSALDRCGISRKEDMGDKTRKRSYIEALRNISKDNVVDWIDCCAILTEEKASFSALLGSGGGSDGNTHFSDNFMQNLWEILPDFDVQRKRPSGSSRALLENALYGAHTNALVANRTSSLYDAGACGGANSGQGFERISLANPWDFVLCIEGSFLFAGAISRRQTAGETSRAAFPFQVRLTATISDSSVEKETAGKEIWLPLWEKKALYKEIVAVFTEGRASIGTKPVERGVDFARATAGLGVDRGIRSFNRYAIVKGRIGGENYNTSAQLGRFDVKDLPDVGLLREIDPWIDRFRLALSEEKAPHRFKSALHRIERAIYSFCQYGGVSRFAGILCALGQAEHELSCGETFRKDKYLRPLAGLSPAWLEAADDGSKEFEIALALAGIDDVDHKIGPLRTNLEPVGMAGIKQGSTSATWEESTKSAVWNSTNLVRNLSAVLERRLMEAEREGCNQLPLVSRRDASLQAISAFIAGEVDDRRIAELLWGLVLIDHRQPYLRLSRQPIDAPPIPRAYALLKLLFSPRPFPVETGDVWIKPEMAILPLLRGNRPADACAIAIRRLRASGLIPMTQKASQNRELFVPNPLRLAAALLIPISSQDIETLKNMVIRPVTHIEAAGRE